MQNLKEAVAALEKVEKEINTVQTELNKAEGRYEVSMKALKDAGYNSIEEAEKAFETKEAAIIARVKKLEDDIDIFLDKYDEVFGNAH